MAERLKNVVHTKLKRGFLAMAVFRGRIWNNIKNTNAIKLILLIFDISKTLITTTYLQFYIFAFSNHTNTWRKYKVVYIEDRDSL